jgi:ACS family hexuronate transporter-like MFS transporter
MDIAFQKLMGGLLEMVSGKGYGAWFLAMAFLHPLALLLLWLGGILRSKDAKPPKTTLLQL